MEEELCSSHFKSLSIKSITSNHITFTAVNVIRYLYIYQKPKNSVVWEGKPNFSFLFKSCEILEVRGDLSINVEDEKSLRVDRQACKNYALA